MARTFKQPGDILELVAPAGGVVSGEPLMIGSLFVIPQITAAADEPFTGAVEETHELAKTSAQAWLAGDVIYWDIANERADNTPVGPQIGTAAAAAANPSSTGVVKLDGIGVRRSLGIAQGTAAAASVNTAGAATITAAQLLTGKYVRDCNGAARIDTLPTAALLVAAIPGAKVGDEIRCKIINGSDAAETLTLAEGAGGGWDALQVAGTRIVAQNDSKELILRLTNVTAAAEAYVAYL